MAKFAQFLFLLVFTLCTASVVIAEAKKAPHLGNISAAQLLEEHKAFADQYQAYQLTEEQKLQLADIKQTAHIDIYFGTWCHDSEREVPRFIKAFEQHPNITYTLIGLDHSKKEPAQRAVAASVKYTPTFIVKQNDKEIGRIIEKPIKDMVYDVWLTFTK